LQRYGEKKLWDLFVIFEKWLELNWNLFSKTRGLLGNFGDCDLITKKPMGLFAKFLR
jgi:hypothetical protein